MNTDAIIDLLRDEVPREVERHAPTEWAQQENRGRCIQSVRVGIEALRYFGVEARPLPTLMLVGNQAWCEWMLAGGEPPMPDESWSVGIDPSGEGRGYPAHLVIALEGFLLDLDAGFYARPQHGIHVPPTILTPLRQQFPGGPIAGHDLEGGGAIIYTAHAAPEPYQGTNAWKHTQKWAGPVIRRMRDRLKEDAA